MIPGTQPLRVIAEDKARLPRTAPDRRFRGFRRRDFGRRRWLASAAILVVLFASRSALRGATPEEMREKVGVYIWGRVPDLAAACSDTRRLGADRAVRMFIGPWSDTPPYRDDLRPLQVKARDAGYQACFRDFPVLMLTAYDSASYAKTYGDPLAKSYEDQYGGPSRGVEAELHHPSHPSLQVAEDLSRMTASQQDVFLSAVREEFRLFSLEISKLDRTFILSNWEAEHDVPQERYWPWFTRYLQARLDGINFGRAEARRQGYPARVFTAFEFTIVPGFQGRPSGLVEIGSKLRGLDFLSYSAWWSIGSEPDAERIKASFRYAFQLIRDLARQRGLPQRIIIGEFGEYWNLYPGAARLKAIVDASLDAGAEYLFNWVLYDQPGEKDEWGRDASHYGKYFQDRTLTPQGRAFRAWFPALVPATANPRRN